MPITTLLLDVGGTLVTPNFERIASEYAADGVVVDARVLERAEAETRLASDRGDGVRRHADVWLSYMLSIAHHAGVTQPPTAAFERLRSYHDTTNLWECVIDGTEAALEGLARRYRLGVVSNANGTVRRKLERVGLGRFFETVVDSAEEGIEKPDPRLFHVALERLGARAEHSAYVGDIFKVDVVGARAAGLHPVLLDPRGAHADKPCDRVATLGEVAALLARTRVG
ncbi:MAG TPA: HAD family hydrolase [Polyangiaceae bacterium]|nr:HAD family hydrolase [Polyangiaceae bacterium]